MSATALTVAALLLSQSQPDQIDVFRGTNRVPQILLSVDLSYSMVQEQQANTGCDWYVNSSGITRQFAGPSQAGTTNLSRLDQLKAALIGCESSDDGLLPTWASRTSFSMLAWKGNATSVSPLYPSDPASRQIFPFETSGPPATSTDLTSLTGFTQSLSSVPFSGTPFVAAYRDSAREFLGFNDTNSLSCRTNAIVMMTDGVGTYTIDRTGVIFDLNGDPYAYPDGSAPVPFDWIPSVTPVSANDSYYCYTPSVVPPTGSPVPLSFTLPPGPNEYTLACNSNGAFPPHSDVAAEYLYGDYGTDTLHDALPNVSGTQPLRTYTIGFQVPDNRARRLLEDMAAAGGGVYIDAQNFSALRRAFEQIIANVQTRGANTFSSLTVQGDGFSSGNYAYQSAFQGADEGHWFGNIKKHCIFPSTPSDNNCLLRYDPALEDFFINPNPVDLWTGTASNEVTVGGAGARVFEQFGSGTTATSSVPSLPWARNIVTWDPDTSSYIGATPDSAALTPADTFSSSLCEHYALLNKLHGYTYDVDPTCPSSSSGTPVAFDFWPLGDTANGGRVLLKYSDSCEFPGDRCYLATVSNTGMLHLFDATTGDEIQAVIPPPFFRSNIVANEQLKHIMMQPGLDATRKYYFDGGLSLYHDDEDANGFITEGEPAYLVAGLGRGGGGYIRWPVSRAPSSGFTAVDHPPQPLYTDLDTSFRNLHDTWAAPWMGEMEVSDGGSIERFPVAVFPSGHQPELDFPNAAFGRPTQRLLAISDTEASPFGATCSDLGIPAEQCAMVSAHTICTEILGAAAPECGSSSATCLPCDTVSLTSTVTGGCDGTAPPCYDFPHYESYRAAAVAGGSTIDFSPYGVVGLSPFQLEAGPFAYATGGSVPSRGIAYRLNLDLDLQPGDRFVVYDGAGRPVQQWVGVSGTVQSPWIYSDSFRFGLIADGVNDGADAGYRITGVDVIRDRNVSDSSAYSTFTSEPSVYLVDLDRWNDASPVGFAGEPRHDGAGNLAAQEEGLRIRFTRVCEGSERRGSEEQCFDRSTFDDLDYMTCPISAEPAVYTEGGFLRAIYVADECGQIFSFFQDADRAGWRVRRLLSTNETDGGDEVETGLSKDFRKIFAKPDLVVSTCTGRRAIGVYFGTGNLQRPVDLGPSGTVPRNLEDDDVTGATNTSPGAQYDVIGVVWDSPTVPLGGYELSDLTNATDPSTGPLDPRTGAAQQGYFIELQDREKSLRRPVVLEGTAFFQTYQPLTAPNECSDAVGRSFVYAFDNCTAEPTATGAGYAGRVVATNPASNIGGDPLVLLPQDFQNPMNPVPRGPLLVSGDAVADSRADLGTDTRRAVRLFLWRIDTE